jgi:hypothetical protein
MARKDSGEPEKEEVEALRQASPTCYAPPSTHAGCVVVDGRAAGHDFAPPPCHRTRWTTLATVLDA